MLVLIYSACGQKIGLMVRSLIFSLCSWLQTVGQPRTWLGQFVFIGHGVGFAQQQKNESWPAHYCRTANYSINGKVITGHKSAHIEKAWAAGVGILHRNVNITAHDWLAVMRGRHIMQKNLWMFMDSRFSDWKITDLLGFMVSNLYSLNHSSSLFWY